MIHTLAASGTHENAILDRDGEKKSSPPLTDRQSRPRRPAKYQQNRTPRREVAALPRRSRAAEESKGDGHKHEGIKRCGKTIMQLGRGTDLAV